MASTDELIFGISDDESAGLLKKQGFRVRTWRLSENELKIVCTNTDLPLSMPLLLYTNVEPAT